VSLETERSAGLAFILPPTVACTGGGSLWFLIERSRCCVDNAPHRSLFDAGDGQRHYAYIRGAANWRETSCRGPLMSSSSV
jgi:hypothetical protein